MWNFNFYNKQSRFKRLWKFCICPAFHSISSCIGFTPKLKSEKTELWFLPNKHNPFSTMSFSRRLRFSVSLSIPNFSSFLQNSSHSHFHSQPPSIQNVDDAVSQFNRMLCMRHTPPIIQFNKILDSFAKIKHYSTAVSLSHRLELKGIQPDLITLNILINCFCHMGQINFGFSLLTKILWGS